MKTSTIRKQILQVGLCLAFVLSSALVQPAAAYSAPQQSSGGPGGGEPLGPPIPGAVFDPLTGFYSSSAEASLGQSSALLDTGGPDYYGYTWNNSVTYSWISALSGTQLDISNSDEYDQGPVTLPFPFAFYENIYNQIYISKAGYLTFSGQTPTSSQSTPPNQEKPNDVIAPYWSPFYMTSGSGIFYRSGGASPNRYFVVEWYKMNGGTQANYTEDNDSFTFEAVLYENGNIKFQYQTMTYGSSWFCGGAGIEDMRGEDGLTTNICNKIPNEKVVLFTRPAATSRVLLESRNFGGFTPAGGSIDLTVNIKNIGDVGADVYDLMTDCAWPLTIRDAASGVPLIDTDDSGYPNTGAIPQAGRTSIIVNIKGPSVGNVGQFVHCSLWVAPMRDGSKVRFAQLDAAIPAPHAQVYTDLRGTGVSLDINEPGATLTFAENRIGKDPAVVEAANGNLVYVWSEESCLGNPCAVPVSEIYYAIRSKTGAFIRQAARLTSQAGEPYSVYDENPAVAVAPDGTIGVTWQRYQKNAEYKIRYNIFFARLNNTGGLLASPANITGHDAYGNWNDNNFINTYQPVIAATNDNRFTLVWRHSYNTSGGWIDNLRLAVYETDGVRIQSPVTITSDSAGSGDAYYSPRVAALAGNRVIIVYKRQSDQDLYFQVRSSAGSEVQAAAKLTKDGPSTDEYSPDVAPLSDGNILVAWRGTYVQYLILKSDYTLLTPARKTLTGYGDTVSVTADKAGHGIIAFGSPTDLHTWYALVSSSGTTITSPVVAHFSLGGYALSYTGGALATHTVSATSGSTDLYLAGKDYAAAPQSWINIPVKLGNLGATTASTITLTLTKPSSVSLRAFSPDATCLGNTCTWTFSGVNLAFLGAGKVSFQASLPPSAVGTEYLLNLAISSPETDGVPANNALQIRLVSALPFYLPVVARK